MPVTFAELTKEVHLLNDFILEDMVYAKDERDEELVAFSKHMFALKNWFTRISSTNKKRFLLALLEDVTSAWTVASVLLFIWNCQTKDAIVSKWGSDAWSSYDQSPLDHNRTAMPLPVLAKVMIADRKWFLSLEPDSQAVVICELLAVTSGPTVMSVLRRAQVIYEQYREYQLQNIEISLQGLPRAKSATTQQNPKLRSEPVEDNKIEALQTINDVGTTPGPRLSSFAQKKLREHLAVWDATINTMKKNLNLEESEVVFKDGTTQNIWKVKRVKPEDIETVDIIQLLPSSLGMMILSYLPRASLPDYARVNKYWAYLVEEFKAALLARTKLDMDIETLQKLVSKNEPSKEIFDVKEKYSNSSITSFSAKSKVLQSFKSSMKSTACQDTFKRLVLEKIMKPEIRPTRIPIRNMADLTERLETRGAVDQDLWKWCSIILKQRMTEKGQEEKEKLYEGGILKLGGVHFACPLLNKKLELPLSPPLVFDHTKRPRPIPSEETPRHTRQKYSLESFHESDQDTFLKAAPEHFGRINENLYGTQGEAFHPLDPKCITSVPCF